MSSKGPAIEQTGQPSTVGTRGKPPQGKHKGKWSAGEAAADTGSRTCHGTDGNFMTREHTHLYHAQACLKKPFCIALHMLMATSTEW